MTEYERPNTVSGLVAKHKELRKLRERYRKEVKKLTISIGHIEACIRLFDPKANASAMKEGVAKPRTKRGSVKRFVLTTLREASSPMTSHEITKRWAEDCGLQADELALTEIRKRISVCIANCTKQGLVERDGQATNHGAFGQYKLWKLKMGG